MALFDLNKWTAEDILDIIRTKLEESISIEFKSSGALKLTDNEKKEMCKDASAFANSDGGLIFYGIEEKDHVATGLSFIDGNTFSKEWIENVLFSGIQRKIEGLTIFPVRFNNNIAESIYVIKIPASSNAPHQARDKKFYKRYNFQSVPMEEYEVRNTYLRKQPTSLKIKNIHYTSQEFERLVVSGIETLTINVHVTIENEGQFPADMYKTLLKVKMHDAIDLNSNGGVRFTRVTDHWQIASVENPVLFAGEVSTALSFEMVFHYFGFPFKEKQLEVQVGLLFPGDEDHATFDLTKKINALYERVWEANQK